MKEIKKHADDSQLLVHISPLERVIYVLAKDNSKHGSVVHQIKVLVTLFIHTHIIYSVLAYGNFCLLITFANSLDPDHILSVLIKIQTI